MRSSRARLRTVLATASAALVLATAVPALAGTGTRFDVLEGRAWYQRATADPCVVDELIVFVSSGRSHVIGQGATVPGYGESAAAVLSSIDVCVGALVGQRFGWTPLAGGMATFDGLESVTLREAAITLAGDGEDVTLELRDLAWAGAGETSPWVWHRGDGPAGLAWDGGPFGPGTHHTERYVTAAAQGSIELGDGTGFTAASLLFAEIGSFQEITNPAP